MVSNVYLHFFRQNNLCLQTLECLLWFPMFIYIFLVKTNFVSKQFQELASEISKILVCLQTLECLLWFPIFIYIFLMSKLWTMWYEMVWGRTE